MAYRVLAGEESFWRPSNRMKVLNTDLAGQLGAQSMGARLWRVHPGQANTRHRHLTETELYLVLEGTGRMRVDDDLLTLTPLSAVLVEPDSVRQIFNDTGEETVWLVVGAPRDQGNPLDMTPEQIAQMYPDGPDALPPEFST